MILRTLFTLLKRRLAPGLEPRPYDLGRVQINDLLPRQGPLQLDLSPWHQDTLAGDALDAAVFAMLISSRSDLARAFELGTGFGRSTSLIALHAPASEVFTFSLPNNPETGRIFHHQPWAGRITQLEGDSLDFDFSPWFGTADLVFVDGCHELPHVELDTLNALRLVKPGGMVLWHDVEADCPDVIRTTQRHAPGARWIAHTRYAVDLAPSPSSAAGLAPGS